MDISVTIRSFELRFSVCNPNIPLKRSLSQNFDLGPTFYFMSKTGNFSPFFKVLISTFDKMKTKA